jgi:hypothetical protein
MNVWGLNPENCDYFGCKPPQLRKGRGRDRRITSAKDLLDGRKWAVLIFGYTLAFASPLCKIKET